MKKIFLALVLVVSFCLPLTTQAASLNGRILLQVQSHGEAWYVSPTDSRRYYMGGPDTAYALMRKFGLGISNKDFNAVSISMPARLLGRILIKVEDYGKAYYIDPSNRQIYYLGRPADAYSLMRERGLGITNTDLNTILIGATSATPPNSITITPTPVLTADQKSVTYTWKYKNKDYSLNEILSTKMYNSYVSSPKFLSYQSNNVPSNLRDSFYSIFTTTFKSGDMMLAQIITDLKSLARANNFNSDETLEFIMAFVQFIPYDHAKVALSNPQPNFIYETLYKNSGICSDKSFLSLAVLRNLGYGAAMFDYPDNNHSAAAVQCQAENSTYNSGYCFIETTNYFPIGVLPQTIGSNNLAESPTTIDSVFNTSQLGRLEVYQKTAGGVYGGMQNTVNQVVAIKNLKNNINTSKSTLDATKLELDQLAANIKTIEAQLNSYRDSGNTSAYNNLVPQYNAAVNSYNSKLEDYKLKIDVYNSFVADYNQSLGDFFQK
jgi:hypothetical protein